MRPTSSCPAASRRLAAAFAASVSLLAGEAPVAAQSSSSDEKHMTTLAAELATGRWQGHANAAIQAQAVLGRPDDTFLLRWHFQSDTAAAWHGATIYLVPTGDREQLRSEDGAVTVQRALGHCVRVDGRITPWSADPRTPSAPVAVSETFCPTTNDNYQRTREQFAGLWRTDIGDLQLAFANGAVLKGEFVRPDARGEQTPYRRVAFGIHFPDRLFGAWSQMESGFGDTAELRVGSDGQLTGRLWLQNGPVTFRGRRAEEDAPPTSPQPTPGGSGSPPPAPSAEQPPASGAFRPLGGFEVRFDRLERPRDAQVVRAVVTIRNATQRVQHLPSGTFRAILTDRDGAGQERNQLWRGSGEPAQVFNGTPTLQPGGELTVRFTFNPDIRDLRSLTLMRADETVNFDLAGR
jgi:hypothetical protein